ncbi:hypothetical protein AAG906_000663 [Vitis piasezkii]
MKMITKVEAFALRAEDLKFVGISLNASIARNFSMLSDQEGYFSEMADADYQASSVESSSTENSHGGHHIGAILLASRKLNSNASGATDEQFKMRIHRSLLCLKCINHGLLETVLDTPPVCNNDESYLFSPCEETRMEVSRREKQTTIILVPDIDTHMKK